MIILLLVLLAFVRPAAAGAGEGMVIEAVDETPAPTPVPTAEGSQREGTPADTIAVDRTQP